MAPLFTGLRLGFGRSAEVAEVAGPLLIQYLVIGGGGGGSSQGGGGAGRYRSNVPGEQTGGALPAESPFTATVSTNYPVIVGTGGASNVSGADAISGTPSVFSTITGAGGGGAPGGSPGGSGDFPVTSPTGGGGGGSGAGTAGTPAPNNTFGGNGGAGLYSSITGSPVARGGGGGGGGTSSGGAGGVGGGAAGDAPSVTSPGVNGTGGGGGGQWNSASASPGGTGIVILRYPNAYTISNPGGGLTMSTSPVSTDKVTQITHPSPGGNVSWSL